jgi:hypothetical protein
MSCDGRQEQCREILRECHSPLLSLAATNGASAIFPRSRFYLADGSMRLRRSPAWRVLLSSAGSI